MNIVKSIAISLLGLSGVTFAQEAPTTAKLLIQLKTGGAAQVDLVSANGGDRFTYQRAGRAAQEQLSNCRLFMIVTPPELASALTSYRANDLEKARTGLAATKRKYAAMAGLPNDPASQAAYYELVSAIRLKDWADVKTLAANYPRKSATTDRLKSFVKVAALLGDLSSASTSGAALQTKIEEFMKDTKAVRALSIENYGFLRYALAEALIAQLPAAEIKDSDLKGENAKKAIKAVDLLCEAAVSQHGANREFVVAALERAARLLWATADARAYLVNIGLNPKMTDAMWKEAPSNFREAVTLAFMARVYSESPLKDKEAAKLLSYYHGPGKEAVK